MNPDQDQDGGSLADRAAAWVPPWQRPEDSAAPVGPAAPVESAKPVDSVEPTAPDESTDRAAPDDPAEAAASNDPGETDDADEPAEPAAVQPASDEADEAGEAAGLAGIPVLADGDTPDEAAAQRAAAESAVAPDDVATEALVPDDVATAASAPDETVAPDDSASEDAAAPDEGAEAADSADWADKAANAGAIREGAAEPADFAPAHEQPMLPGLSGPELDGAIEAILLVVDEPVTEEQLGDVLDVSAADVADRLVALARQYADGGRGFELRRAAGGWRLYTRGDYSAYVERFVLDGQSVRLTQAALETLAVIAYQQPVTRSRISAIRGVNCDGVVRTLVTRGLVEECGIQPESGAHLYQTTALFLEKLGLDSVAELPPLAPFLPDDVNGLTDAR